MDKLTFALLLGACLIGVLTAVTLLVVAITHIPTYHKDIEE